jgi:hypothetical protein
VFKKRVLRNVVGKRGSEVWMRGADQKRGQKA